MLPVFVYSIWLSYFEVIDLSHRWAKPMNLKTYQLAGP